MSAVQIVERIAPGKTLYTDAEFLTPEELRAESRAEQGRRQQGERARGRAHSGMHTGRVWRCRKGGQREVNARGECDGISAQYRGDGGRSTHR